MIVAVADNPATRIQRRPDHPLDQLVAGGVHQQRFGPVEQVTRLALDQQRSDALCRRAATGLAHVLDVAASRRQRLHQLSGLRGLTGAVRPLYDDEFTLHVPSLIPVIRRLYSEFRSKHALNAPPSPPTPRPAPEFRAA